jgi:hypothetical protein
LRLPNRAEPREAFGLRRVYRRFRPLADVISGTQRLCSDTLGGYSFVEFALAHFRKMRSAGVRACELRRRLAAKLQKAPGRCWNPPPGRAALRK